MQGDPAVIKALNDVFLLEATNFEVVHAYEHVMQRRKYKGLKCWFDRQVDCSRARRRYLTDRCFALDGVLVVAIQTTTVDPKAPPESFLSSAMDMATGLLAAYQAAYEVAESAGDNNTADELCSLQKDVEAYVLCLESFAGLINDIGLQAFLALKIKS